MGDMADEWIDQHEAEMPLGFGYGGMSHNENRKSPRPRRANGWGKHPSYTPQRKAHTMAHSKNPRLRKLEHELDANLSLRAQLEQEEILLRADIRKADVPAAPPERHDMFRVLVQFSAQGPTYTYLLARSGGAWFTTGARDEQKKFPDWFALCEWLNSTYWHSALDVLGVDIERAYPTEREDQVPF